MEFQPNVITLSNGESAYEYCDVAFSADSIIELDNGRPLLVIPREQIQRSVVKHGFSALHPLLEGLFGSILLAIGVVPVVLTNIAAILHPRLAKYAIYLLFVGFVGLLVLYSGLRRGYFLEMWTSKGRRKIVFSKKAGVTELEQTLKTVNESFGYGIASDI